MNLINDVYSREWERRYERYQEEERYKKYQVAIEKVFEKAKEVIESNMKVEEPVVDKGKISDGYHTFDELYEHRITLFIALCKKSINVWRSKLHSDGSAWEGWFLLGINYTKGRQITYHLPISKWDECNFATTLDKAPEFDGHTSEDVLLRIKTLL